MQCIAAVQVKNMAIGTSKNIHNLAIILIYVLTLLIADDNSVVLHIIAIAVNGHIVGHGVDFMQVFIVSLATL